LGVFIDDKLVGITSLIRETRQKLRHKPGIYGVFIDRPHRQKDLGRMLINQAIQQAKRMRGVKPD
jgi:GNAT superfamily N-acetyltransferase